MKKLLVALLFLLAPAAFAGPYTLTVHNYTNKTFHWHQDAVNVSAAGCNYGICATNAYDVSAFDINIPAADNNVKAGEVSADLPSAIISGFMKAPALYINLDVNDVQNSLGFKCDASACYSSIFNQYSSPRLEITKHVSTGTPCGLIASNGTPACSANAVAVESGSYENVTFNYDISIYPSAQETDARATVVLDTLKKEITNRLDALNTSIDTSVKNEVQHTDVVQTSVNNFLTTTSGNQTNLVNAVSTAMQSARDAAALDTKDYGVNNFYPSMTKQSADGKYLVYPAQSFTLSGGCVLNAAPNNYLTVAHDANQEKNATQLLTAMVLGRRVEITQHQKDLETTDCGVIDSVKILDK